MFLRVELKMWRIGNMDKIKKFVTYKCRKCNNVMRSEYNNGISFLPCCVCLSNKWVKIIMEEVNKRRK